MKTDNETLVKALRLLARDIVSDDGVANACIEEAAGRIEGLVKEYAELSHLRAAVGQMQQEIDTLRSREMDADDIADYSEDRAKLKAENEQLKLAKSELVEVLEGVKERLDYLVDLWGNEGVTNRVVQSIKTALAKHGG